MHRVEIPSTEVTDCLQGHIHWPDPASLLSFWLQWKLLHYINFCLKDKKINLSRERPPIAVSELRWHHGWWTQGARLYVSETKSLRNNREEMGK